MARVIRGGAMSSSTGWVASTSGVGSGCASGAEMDSS